MLTLCVCRCVALQSQRLRSDNAALARERDEAVASARALSTQLQSLQSTAEDSRLAGVREVSVVYVSMFQYYPRDHAHCSALLLHSCRRRSLPRSLVSLSWRHR
jgi:hypothetical protein